MFNVEVLWVVTPCNVMVGHQRFRGQCCLHLHAEDGRSMDLWKVGIPPQNYSKITKLAHQDEVSSLIPSHAKTRQVLHHIYKKEYFRSLGLA